jgi:hypothetical protein
MKNKILIILLLVLVLVGAYFMLKPKSGSKEIEEKAQPQFGISSGLVEGNNKDDLVSFSILPDAAVSGLVSYKGVVKGGYFFEANILINILDENKNIMKKSNATATTDWMTQGPVSFEGNIDFAAFPKGKAYIEIHNDNASGEAKNDKSILIPITIK